MADEATLATCITIVETVLAPANDGEQSGPRIVVTPPAEFAAWWNATATSPREGFQNGKWVPDMGKRRAPNAKTNTKEARRLAGKRAEAILGYTSEITPDPCYADVYEATGWSARHSRLWQTT